MHGLRDVFQLMLSRVLQHVMFFDPLRRLRSDYDLAAFGQARDARGEIRRRARGGEGPTSAARRVELGRAHERRAAVDPDVNRDSRIDADELAIETSDLGQKLKGGC